MSFISALNARGQALNQAYRPAKPAAPVTTAKQGAFNPVPFDQQGTTQINKNLPNLGLSYPQYQNFQAAYNATPDTSNIDQYLGIGSYNQGGDGFDLTSDPAYQAALAQQQLGLAQLQNNLKAAQEQALIQFGDPNAASWAGFGLDPQAADFAKQNYLSGNATLARLDKQHDLTRKAVIDRLAGSGLLFSGDTGYQEGQADQAYGNDVYDARQKVLQLLNGYQNQYLNAAQNSQSSLLNALLAAFSSYAQNPGAYGGGNYGGSGGGLPAFNNTGTLGGSIPAAAGQITYNTPAFKPYSAATVKKLLKASYK